jgi:hypothetical protein
MRRDQLEHAIRIACQIIGRHEVIVVGSPFEELHGFSIDGVDLSTPALPTGWRRSLVKVQDASTAAPDGEPQYTGWCLDKEDVCVAKLRAFRERTRTSPRRPCAPPSPTVRPSPPG